MPWTKPTGASRRVRVRDVVSTGREVQKHHLPLSATRRIRKWSVVLIEDLDAIDRIETEWRKLTPELAAPFLTFSWNRAWFRVYQEDCGTPSIFCFQEDGVTTAILPCYRKGKVFRLAGDNICDYQDIVTQSEESAKMAVSTLLLWMRKNAKQCHFHFEKLSSEGHLYGVLSERNGDPSSVIFEKHFAPCPYVSLQGGLENYLTSLPRKTRGDLRRALNRLEREAPSARVTICRDFDIRANDLESAAAFHVEYFRKNGVSPLADPRLVSLLGEVAKDPEVGLHLSHFTDQSETLAVDFGFARGGRYYGYLGGFNPNCGKLAPSKCLLLSRIDQWVEKDGVEFLDFLAGDEDYKKGFTQGREYSVKSIRLMSNSIVWRMFRVLLEGEKCTRTLAKMILRRTGVVIG